MKVRATEAMSSEDFAKHMSLRHAQVGELADLKSVAAGAVESDKDRSIWEAYHSRLHETQEYQHGHQ